MTEPAEADAHDLTGGPHELTGDPDEVPTPAPGLVAAARSHLTGRYATGVEALTFRVDQVPMPDRDAIEAVLDSRDRGENAVDGPDLAAALVLVAVARQDLDRMEADLFDEARAAGLTWEAIAAVLEMSGSEAARRRYGRLSARRRMPSSAAGAATTSKDTSPSENTVAPAAEPGAPT